jgi:hypothetical protein
MAMIDAGIKIKPAWRRQGDRVPAVDVQGQ